MSDEQRPDETEEEFLDRMDPYGDRFGTAIPWWGCLGPIVLIAAIGWYLI